jgi:hypothetical protein
LLKRRHKHNKKHKAFLLVELRIAIQIDSQHCFHVQMCYNQVDSSLTDLYTGSWSPSRVDLCHFKVFVLAPLEWGHQAVSCFGFSTYPHTSWMRSPLVVWPSPPTLLYLP